MFFYIIHLRDKVFKLLPMREDYDNGEDNHVFDYLDNLISNIEGGLLRFPSLSSNANFIEACNYLVYLRSNNRVSFKKWRSIVLRSTRLINSVLKSKSEDNHG